MEQSCEQSEIPCEVREHVLAQQAAVASVLSRQSACGGATDKRRRRYVRAAENVSWRSSWTHESRSRYTYVLRLATSSECRAHRAAPQSLHHRMVSAHTYRLSRQRRQHADSTSPPFGLLVSIRPHVSRGPSAPATACAPASFGCPPNDPRAPLSPAAGATKASRAGRIPRLRFGLDKFDLRS